MQEKRHEGTGTMPKFVCARTQKEYKNPCLISGILLYSRANKCTKMGALITPIHCFLEFRKAVDQVALGFMLLALTA
jgi:hypothetical protein